MTRVLFLCSQNHLRSPTAEAVFSDYSHLEVRSAGLDNNAVRWVTGEDLRWAGVVFVMKRSHRNRLLKKYHALDIGKRIICLDIPDIYECMDPELMRLLLERAGRHLLCGM